MRRYAPIFVALAFCLALSGGLVALGVIPTAASARMVAGECFRVYEDSGGVEYSRVPVDPSFCPQPTATTAPPTNTAVPPTATSVPPTPTSAPVDGLCPGEDNDHWHPPVINGCATGHEHGSAPPSFVTSSAWMPMFTHAGNTPNENLLKHSSFKGFLLVDDGVQVYVIAHLDTNPSGHSSRFHSVQIWARDATGGVSHWDYWMDFGTGNNTGPQLRALPNCPGGTTAPRPIMAVNYASCPSTGFEVWYSSPGQSPWGFDFGFALSPNYYSGPTPGVQSNPDPAAFASWLPTGGNNGTRRMEAAHYQRSTTPIGTFYTTQFGTRVSGPNDPICGTTVNIGAKSYQVLCIAQYIAPTMTTVQFPGNAIQVQHDMTGVTLPN